MKTLLTLFAVCAVGCATPQMNPNTGVSSGDAQTQTVDSLDAQPQVVTSEDSAPTSMAVDPQFGVNPHDSTKQHPCWEAVKSGAQDGANYAQDKYEQIRDSEELKRAKEAIQDGAAELIEWLTED